MRLLFALFVLLALPGCPGGSSTDSGSDRDVPGLDAPSPLDVPERDTPELDAPASDAGPRCPACTGSVVVAMRGSMGFSVTCPAGQVVGFAGTPSWLGPGTELIANACAQEPTPGGEATFYVCCVAASDAGTDAGADAPGTLGSGDVCDPSASLCGPGLSCCYPCGIPDCDFQCEPTCGPSDPGCVDGCLLRP